MRSDDVVVWVGRCHPTRPLPARTRLPIAVTFRWCGLLRQIDIPAFNWPSAPFPKLKYPLADNVDANAKEEKRCLEALDAILAKNPVPVVAVIVEPVQGVCAWLCSPPSCLDVNWCSCRCCRRACFCCSCRCQCRRCRLL